MAIKPDLVKARVNLAQVLAEEGETACAVSQWREVVRIEPNNLLAVNQLAWAMATRPEASLRNGAEAAELAQWAVKLSCGLQPIPLATLAAAYAESGRFAEAVEIAERAIALATAQHDTATAAALRRQSECYHAGAPTASLPAPLATNPRRTELPDFLRPMFISPERRTTMRTVLVICCLLAAAVVVVFGQTVGHGFVNFDDNVYVCNNPHIAHGLTGETVAWSFTAFYASNWHPLTWLSHALDCQLYGTQHPGLHHLTNVVLHAAVAIALFLVLWRMTGELWPSAFAAAVFAVHPLRAESVAWISERKDLLSGLFFVLTLAAYLHYVRHRFSWGRYLLVIAMFALGLLAKPMLVTLPFVLLLLDYWPLGRFATQWSPWFPRSAWEPAEVDAWNPAGRSHAERGNEKQAVWRLIGEKLPLLLLAGASCVITSLAQSRSIAVAECLPLSWRIANALVGYVAYIGQFFWPASLAAFYPHPENGLPLGEIAAALLVLGGLSVTAWLGRRRCPYLLVGWLWYLGMLVPVIGLVQVGDQARADRYTYLPAIGLCIALAWGGSAAVRAFLCGGAGIPVCRENQRTLRRQKERLRCCRFDGGADRADGRRLATDVVLA